MKRTEILQQLAPEALEQLKMRYHILHNIQYCQPVGRRALAERLDLSERVMRRELEYLQKEGLLSATASGVLLTVKAMDLMVYAQAFIREISGLPDWEKVLAEKLGLAKAVIVPGDADEDASVQLNMGRAAAMLLVENLAADSIIAVMGGWTMARVAEMVRGNYPDVIVVPARGGLGDEVEIQANTVAAKLAYHLGASYKMLHVPENLDPQALNTLLKDQRIRSVVSIIRNANILVYGIGRADIMARRRGLSKHDTAHLLTRGAVAEALGTYYDKGGRSVDMAPSLGIEVPDQPKLSLSLAVAGGKNKAPAIVAALQRSRGQVLVTDQGAASEILRLLKGDSV
jgi:central glycolytic genes regulator